MQPHSSNLRLHRVKDVPSTFFVTKCVWPRIPVLNPDLRAIVCRAFLFSVESQRIILRAFVVMPDHWHVLLGLLYEWTLPRFMHALMSHVGGQTHNEFTKLRCSWQQGYFETRVRSIKQLDYIARYIIDNPIRKGLVHDTKEWDASSLKHPSSVTISWPWKLEKD